jgi:aspartate/methionine/tyrosine aminotransferase
VNEYSPVAGLKPLREAVANLYNQRFRQGKKSVYTWKNVCITPGGRSALTRLAASIGNVRTGECVTRELQGDLLPRIDLLDAHSHCVVGSLV